MSDIVEWLHKCSSCIYLATDKSVADDIAPKVLDAASEIIALRKAVRACKALRDNINEFGSVTDGEIFDAASSAIDSALSQMAMSIRDRGVEP